jgi:7,8-dihydropterin-6-yl-methyl-4-(beta-D-ribofuranosyl)aminobenzene 5'-phosphate synthase
VPFICVVPLATEIETATAAEHTGQITIIYDALAMTKDWGFFALVEIAGKRILFDTGNDRDIFGSPPEIMKFGTAWQGANFEPIDKTTEIAPGIGLIALVSDTPGTKELKELHLAVNAPEGMVLVVGCSHPGIERIVEAATSINPKIRLIVGGFHLVVAPDDVVATVVASLKNKFKAEYIAPGDCTGEPTFAALKQAFGDRYLYAGVGTTLALGPSVAGGERRGEAPALDEDDLSSYRRLAAREDPFGVLALRARKQAARPSPSG